MLAAVLSGYIIGLIVPLGVRIAKSAAGPFVAVLAAFLFAYFLQFVPGAAEGRPWRFAFAWGGPGGLEAAFRLDALALFFALLITALTALAAIATAGLSLSDEARGRLLVAMMALMSSSLGFVLAQTPALMMGFSVLASLSAFLLLTAERGAPERAARIPVLMALLGGDLLLMAGLAGLFPGGNGGTLPELLVRPLPREPVAILSGALLVISGFAKLALLPAELRAKRQALMSAPAALVAYGAAYLPLLLYVILRFAPVLANTVEYRFLLGLSGAILLVVGGLTGMRARALRTLLAGVSVLMMGIALIQLATFDGKGHTVALLVVLSHALGIGVFFLAAQMAAGGSANIELRLLRLHMRDHPDSLVFMILGVLSLGGLVPSIGLLLLSKSLEAGLGAAPNGAKIAFMIIGHALLIAVLLKILRSLIIPSPGQVTICKMRGISAISGVLVLLAGAFGLGWRPMMLERLFIAPAIYPPAAVMSIGPFWPQGVGVVLTAITVIGAGLLLWFVDDVGRALDWMARASRRRPDRLWRHTLELLARFSNLCARITESLGYARGPAAITLVLSSVLAWVGLVAMGVPPSSLPEIMPLTGALAAIAGLAALLALAQRSCENALPLISIGGVITGLLVLSAGVLDLAYLMILIVVLETAMFLVLAPRVAMPEQAPSRLGRAGRIALSVLVGTSAALVSLIVPNGAARAPSWTSFDQFQLWLAIVVMLLVLGVIITELNRQRMRGAA